MTDPSSTSRPRGLSRKLQILVNEPIDHDYEEDKKTLECILSGQHLDQTMDRNKIVSKCKYLNATNRQYMNLAHRRRSRSVRDNIQTYKAAWSSSLKELKKPLSETKRDIFNLFNVPRENPKQYQCWRENYLREFEEDMTQFCDTFEQWTDNIVLQMSQRIRCSPTSIMYYNMNWLSELNSTIKDEKNPGSTRYLTTYKCTRLYRSTTKAGGQAVLYVEPKVEVSNNKRNYTQHTQSETSHSEKKKIKLETKKGKSNLKSESCGDVIFMLNNSARDSPKQTNDNHMDKAVEDKLKEGVSLFLSKTLDCLGYSYNMIKHRQYMYRSDDKVIARFKSQLDVRITTGGKGEGTAMYFENDTDYMFVSRESVCADNPEQFKAMKHIFLFQTVHENSPPGYARLKLIKLTGHSYRDQFRASLVEENDGSFFVSSSAFLDSINKAQEVYENRDGLTRNDSSGPSTPLSDKYDSYDDVMSFPCYCPDVIARWVSRPRSHGWPDAEKIHEISIIDGHIVPVGFKGSSEQNMEWRICFSLAELNLMQSLNECQIQMYIVLKEIAKKCLKPTCKEMTSYIMKNITLWMCETNHIAMFNKMFLLNRVLDALRLLKNCIVRNNLPSYMISERNLLAGRLQSNQRKQLEILLGELLVEDSCLLLRSDRLREGIFAMYKMPSILEHYAKRRDLLERIMLLRNWIREFVWVPNSGLSANVKKARRHVAYNTLQKQMDVLLQCDDESLRKQGLTDAVIRDFMMEKLTLILS